MVTRPRLDLKTCEAELEVLSRAPFREALARILGAEPDRESVLAYAERFPDRWGQLVAIFGRLAGYSEKLEVDGRLAAVVGSLSDSEINQRLVEVERRLLALDAISKSAPGEALLTGSRAAPGLRPGGAPQPGPMRAPEQGDGGGGGVPGPPPPPLSALGNLEGGASKLGSHSHTTLAEDSILTENIYNADRR